MYSVIIISLNQTGISLLVFYLIRRADGEFVLSSFEISVRSISHDHHVMEMRRMILAARSLKTPGNTRKVQGKHFASMFSTLHKDRFQYSCFVSHIYRQVRSKYFLLKLPHPFTLQKNHK